MKRETALLSVYILEILRHNADREHPMTQATLLEKLKERPYELFVSHNTLSVYLSALKQEGLIYGNRGNYAEKVFDDNELRLLIDGVLFGKHIATDLAYGLINKLKGQAGKGLKNRLRNISYLPNLTRTDNTSLYKMIDTIDEAINQNKKIKVVRCKYDVNNKLIPSDNEYILDPYYLVCDNSRYFLICHMRRNGKNIGLVNLRVDRFMEVQILTDRVAMDIRTIEPYQQGFHLDEYMQEHIYMFSGDSITAKLRIKKQNITDFIDWYGKKFRIYRDEGEYVIVRCKVNEKALVHWTLQYSEIATVIHPQSVRKKILEQANKMIKVYEDTKGEQIYEKN